MLYNVGVVGDSGILLEMEMYNVELASAFDTLVSPPNASNAEVS